PVDPPKPTDPPVINLGCGENSYWNEELKMCVCEPPYINWEGAGVGCLTEYVPPVVDPIVDPEIPEETETPDVSETPEITETPVVTDSPEVTNTPVITDAPDNGNDTSASPMSIANILMILLTLIVGGLIVSGKNEDGDNQNLLKFKVMGVVLSVVSVVVFFLTGGIQSTFVMFDSLTPVFGIIFAAVLGVLGLEKFTISKK
ncbi:MAG: hypothetical protein ACK5KQ_02940, partial [Anaerorhabdus sp.]